MIHRGALDPTVLAAIYRRLQKMRPAPIWLGRPRPRRDPAPLPKTPTGISKALRSLRRSARRESPLTAHLKMAAAQKRHRRRQRNRDWAYAEGIKHHHAP